MSIAEGIMDIVKDYAAENQAKSVKKIGLRIGAMAGVVEESLRFSFNMLAKGTPAEGAEIVIETVPLTGRCTKCGRVFPIEGYNFWCPECKDGVLKVETGNEMQVEYLDME